MVLDLKIKANLWESFAYISGGFQRHGVTLFYLNSIPFIWEYLFNDNLFLYFPVEASRPVVPNLGYMSPQEYKLGQLGVCEKNLHSGGTFPKEV